jgi:predicted DNA-binding transcriptional regulator YafY
MTQLLEFLNDETENDRRTLYEDIRDLEYLGTKVKISKGYAPPRLNVEERLFSISELKLMIDAVASSKFLMQSATQEIIGKLKQFCSRYEATELNRQTLLANRTKRIDAEYHDNVGILSKAIDAKRKVTFKYFRLNIHNRRDYQKKEIIVTPWILLYANDNYYLLAFDGKQMKYYRLDRIDSVEILDMKSEGEEEYEKVKEELPFRTQSSFNLFGGEKVDVTLKCPVYYYYLIADQFGQNLYPMMDKNKEFFTVTVPVAIGDQFFGWVLSMGQKVVIVGPPEVKKQMARLFREALARCGR